MNHLGGGGDLSLPPTVRVCPLSIFNFVIGLLSENGFIMVDNSLCSLLYDSADDRSKTFFYRKVGGR